MVPFGQYQAMAVSPLASGRLNPPDICLVYATPGQMIILINGLQYTGYRKFEWGVVGETACADSWGRALKTGEPSLSLPCFAERRYGGVPDEEMLMALPPAHLAKAIAGMKQLAKNGLRYPIAPYGIQADVAPAWVCRTRRNSSPSNRHCEERSDEAMFHIVTAEGLLDCSASLAMTGEVIQETEKYVSSKFDIVVYGATGFTGQLVAEYLAAQYKGDPDLKWAMAGRSKEKLAAVRDAIGAPADTPLIVADASDPASLKAMVAQTKSVITTVGPSIGCA